MHKTSNSTPNGALSLVNTMWSQTGFEPPFRDVPTRLLYIVFVVLVCLIVTIHIPIHTTCTYIAYRMVTIHHVVILNEILHTNCGIVIGTCPFSLQCKHLLDFTGFSAVHEVAGMFWPFFYSIFFCPDSVTIYKCRLMHPLTVLHKVLHDGLMHTYKEAQIIDTRTKFEGYIPSSSTSPILLPPPPPPIDKKTIWFQI